MQLIKIKGRGKQNLSHKVDNTKETANSESKATKKLSQKKDTSTIWLYIFTGIVLMIATNNIDIFNAYLLIAISFHLKK